MSIAIIALNGTGGQFSKLSKHQFSNGSIQGYEACLKGCVLSSIFNHGKVGITTWQKSNGSFDLYSAGGGQLCVDQGNT